ncbi:hypothetical protein B0H19DRAFT_1072766 [Mycena capillaripes]|nr:hypothetical protein B0H19DRAFT_1072766 [Mycena capillaripes]
MVFANSLFFLIVSAAVAISGSAVPRAPQATTTAPTSLPTTGGATRVSCTNFSESRSFAHDRDSEYSMGFYQVITKIFFHVGVYHESTDHSLRMRTNYQILDSKLPVGACENAEAAVSLRSDPPVGTGLPNPNRQMRRQTSVPTLADRVHQSAFKSNFPDRVLICQDMCPKTNSHISAATNLDQGRPRSATIGEPPSAKIDQDSTWPTAREKVRRVALMPMQWEYVEHFNYYADCPLDSGQYYWLPVSSKKEKKIIDAVELRPPDRFMG